MKIGILSRNKNLYSINSLVEAFRKRDHDVEVEFIVKHASKGKTRTRGKG